MEGGRKPPMSRDDSLVVVRVKVEGWREMEATNESLRLVGSLFGQPEGGGWRVMDRVCFGQNRGWREATGGLFGRVEGRGDGWGSSNSSLVKVEGGGR